jgi:lysophospholipase L1-like esterase
MKTMSLLVKFSLALALIACSEPEAEPDAFIEQEQQMEEEKYVEGTYNYLALGDSYTIGESVDTDYRFPVQLAERLNERGLSVSEPKIIARTGWTTDELDQGIRGANLTEEYNLVSLLIGVNNQYQGRDTAEYRTQFSDLLKQAIAFAKNRTGHVIVVSIPDWGVTPFGQSFGTESVAKQIDDFNRINTDETQKAGAHYVDITGISRRAKDEPELVAADGLHPSAEMYRLWVQEILPVAEDILKNQSQ